MNVKDLIEKLQEFDPETDVLIAIDPEGNGFNPLASDGVVLSHRNHEGEPCNPDDADEDISQMVVLWP